MEKVAQYVNSEWKPSKESNFAHFIIGGIYKFDIHTIEHTRKQQSSHIKIFSLSKLCLTFSTSKMENIPHWFSLTNMIYLFLLNCVVKFILESNCFIKSLIPLFGNPSKTTPNHSVSRSDDGEDEDEYDVSILMEKMGLSCEPEEEVKTDEVSRIFEEREPSIEELRAAFDVFDQNKDGFIDASELKRVIEILGLGKGFDLGACKRMIRVFVKDDEDRIDSDGFIGVMRRALC